MLGFSLRLDDRTPTVLCVGAHCDDIEIGCGGTLRQLRALYPDAPVHWVVLSSTPERRAEALDSALNWLPGAPPEVQVFGFRDGFLPYDPIPVKTQIGALAASVSPDVVFAHSGKDAHQDHRFVSELVWNHFRDHVVLEYEIPKYDADLGHPNVFVPLSRSECERKAADILSVFRSQRGKDWLTVDTVLALARLRGIESRSPTGFAEGFHLRKAILF